VSRTSLAARGLRTAGFGAARRAAPAPPHAPGARHCRERRGYTLIEILAVVAIIALLAGLVAPRLLRRATQARQEQARVQLERLRAALELYRADHDIYPTTRQGLAALVQRPSLPPRPERYPPGGYVGAEALRDPWGRELSYRCDDDGAGPFVIICWGADGRPGGEGAAADLQVPPPTPAAGLGGSQAARRPVVGR